MTSLRGWRRNAERSAQLGLLAADRAMRSGDAVTMADQRTTRDDYRAALVAVRDTTTRRRRTRAA